MVCDKCEKKLAKLACPDVYKWKDGDKKGKAPAASTSSGRAINENKMLSTKKRWAPYGSKCTVCKSTLPKDYLYCQKCAYVKGLCAMCGTQVLDTAGYKQSTA